MASALNAPRTDAFKLDPHDQLVIIAPVARDDAGPQDRVDPNHPACEHEERPWTEDEVRDFNTRGILQPIRAIRDGSDLAIVVIGRRRTRIARVVNDLRHEWNKGKVNYLFETKRAEGEKELEFLTVPTMLMPAASEEQIREAILVENMQRADYTPRQVAGQFKRFIDLGYDPARIARIAGKQPFTVTSHLAYFDLSKELQAAVDTGKVAISAAAKMADMSREEQTKALQTAEVAGTTITLNEARRAVKRSKKGADAAVTPSKGEVARMLALLQGNAGEMTPKERSVAIEMLEWVRSGKRPKEFKLPRMNTQLPDEK